MNLRLLLLLLLFLPGRSMAQLPTHPVFQHILPEKFGLDKMSGAQTDKKGRVWMLSDHGLICYNGYSSITYPARRGENNSPMSNFIQSFFIDSKQRLWLAYQDTAGVTKFDPDQNLFTHFLPDSTRKDAASNYLVTRFYEDTKNRLWVLTWGDGMAQLDPEKGSFTFYRAKKGQDPQNFVFDKHYLPHNAVKNMAELPDGRFLLGFFDEYSNASYPAYFDPDKKTFALFPLDDYLKNVDPTEASHIKYTSKIIHYIHVDKNQNIWFGTYSNLSFFDTKKHIAKRISGRKFSDSEENLDNARAYAVDERNQIMWVGTPNKGILVVDMNSLEAGYIQRNPQNPSSLYDNRILSVTKDRDGNLWISSGYGVISIYSPLVQQFSSMPWDEMDLNYTDQSQQPIPVQQMLVVARNAIYISSENGLTIYDGEKMVIKEKIKRNDLSAAEKGKTASYRIANFKPMKDGRLLAIAPEKARIYNPKTRNFKLIDAKDIGNSDMRILFRHSQYNERVFVSSFRPNIIYEIDQNDQYKKVMQVGRYFGPGDQRNINPHERYTLLLPDGKWMLAATGSCFFIIDIKDTSSLIYGSKNVDRYFPDSTINTAYLDPLGKIWVCTQNGLYQFNHTTGKTEYWSKKIGLDHQAVKAMTTDKNGICWLALDKHIARWDPKTNRTFIFRSELGLNAGEFLPSIAQTDEYGNIYLVSLNGIIRFNPDNMVVPDQKPKLSLSFLSIKDDTLGIVELQDFMRKENHLGWDENFLSMEFSTSQVYTPAPHRFYYRLVGLDSTWQDNGTSNRLRYTNLADGDYSLEIKIVNIYNIESEILQIKFSIARPYWKSWWFYLLLAAALGTGIWIMIRLRERAHRKREEELEDGIRQRTAEIVTKAEEIRLQKDIIEDKNKELTDSIHYAQKIQQSILPNRSEISKYLPEHLILFKPKDIVSGDFYWFSHQKDSVLWAVVDCTGHGVPGGFMSMLGSGLLNQIVNEEQQLEPAAILNQLRERVIIALKQTGTIGENRDGMDISLCRYIPSTGKLQYAGANNPLYVLRKGELQEITADKQPIGIHVGEKKPFTLHEMTIEKGDILYMSSDGYADQFGGEKGKKFKSSNFEKLLVQINAQNMPGQLHTIEDTFIRWKGDYEQLDDVCIIGVKL